MQRNVHSLTGYSLDATDGKIGKVEELYFDDQSWTIRYLIVKTGNWLSGRKVLISPDAIVKTSWEPGTFLVNLTKEQIRNSPDIDTDKPVSRQQEIALYGHYPWPEYWGSGFYAGGFSVIGNTSPVIDQEIVKEADPADKRSDDDPHLRSTHRVTGYRIHATDGEIGHVKDFIIDDQNWQIIYLVIDTRHWFGGKKVLMAVGHIKEIKWDLSEIFVDSTVDSVKNYTAFDESEFSHQEPFSAAPDNYNIHIK